MHFSRKHCTCIAFKGGGLLKAEGANKRRRALALVAYLDEKQANCKVNKLIYFKSSIKLLTLFYNFYIYKY